MAARRIRPRRGFSAVLALVVLTAVACSSSGYTYISSSSTRTFLKVPDDWKVFKKDEVLSKADTNDYLAFDKTDRFLVAFDGNPKPSLAHSFVTGAYPFGQVRVRELAQDEADMYSFATLRNEVVAVDDLFQADQVELLAPIRQVTKKGLRGTQLEYSVERAEGGKFHVSQIGFIDTATRNVWFLLVGCSSSCYTRHAGAIHRVIDSWTVEGK